MSLCSEVVKVSLSPRAETETETKLQDWRKSDSPLSDEETVSASDFHMEKAEALMMVDVGKEKEEDEASQNEINIELGRV